MSVVRKQPEAPTGREAYWNLVGEVLESLRRGVLPWRKPWVVLRPVNLYTRARYSGLNVLHLTLAAERRGFRSPHWITARQALRRGGSILPGEVANPSFVMGLFSYLVEYVTPRGQRLLRHVIAGKTSPVYNVEQARGLSRLLPPAPTLDLWSHKAECIVRAWSGCPPLGHHPDRACYRPSTDEIYLPERSTFSTTAAYYSTLFHEMVHATGHPDRLNRVGFRPPWNEFADASYAFEELIAELGSTFLCAEAGIANETLQDNSAYIGSWLQALGRDRAKLFLAAHLAERACDHILGRTTVAARVNERSGPDEGKVEPQPGRNRQVQHRIAA